ncbi:FGGY-family carbohydrate kinase [Pectinatus sottacetonis]|uniref:FGGY-family carbohydrate kinase n=1 Tax=Pectinatus sottacetonis TaxID=1002795 RepID=UPI0018C47E08|nr:FGGY family carbohydrate kinase [Pectinatus sottacetonis]
MGKMKVDFVLDIGSTNTKISLYSINSKNFVIQKKFNTPKILKNNDEDFNYIKLWEIIKKQIILFNICDLYTIEKIIIASVGETGVLITKTGHVIGPMIAWYDKRGENYLDLLSQTDIKEIYTITGLPVHSNYSVFKIKWLYDKFIVNSNINVKWLNLPNYIAYLLTEKKTMDYTLASRTMLLDIKNKQWSSFLLKKFSLPSDIMPKIIPNNSAVGIVSDVMKKCLKFSSDCKVYIAGHDHMSGSVAVDLKNNELLNSTGTTEALLSISNTIKINEHSFKSKLSNGIYIDSKKYTLFASLPCAGICFESFQKLFNYNYENLISAFKILEIEYARSPIINEANLFFPHLRGNGSPEKNVFAKGLYYGFTNKLSSNQILFDISVGLCLELKNLYNCFDDLNNNFNIIKVIGPAVKNEFWLQLKADVLNKTIIAINIPETVSYGAVCYFEGCNVETTKMKKYLPNKSKVAFFENLYNKYKKIYDFKVNIEKQYI